MSINDVRDYIGNGKMGTLLFRLVLTGFVTVSGWLGTSLNAKLDRQDQALQHHGEALSSMSSDIKTLIEGQSQLWTRFDEAERQRAAESAALAGFAQKLDDHIQRDKEVESPR